MLLQRLRSAELSPKPPLNPLVVAGSLSVTCTAHYHTTSTTAPPSQPQAASNQVTHYSSSGSLRSACRAMQLKAGSTLMSSFADVS